MGALYAFKRRRRIMAVRLFILLIATTATVVAADPEEGIPKRISVTRGARTSASDAYVGKIREMNPGFDVVDYDDAAAADYVRKHYAYDVSDLPAVYDRVAALGRPAVAAGLFRLAVVAREGGFFFDASTSAATSLGDLGKNASAVFPLEAWRSREAFAARHAGAEPRDALERWQVGDRAFGATPGHRLVSDALDEAARRCEALAPAEGWLVGLARFAARAYAGDAQKRRVFTDLDVARAAADAVLSDVYHGGRLAKTPRYGDVTLLRGADAEAARAHSGANDDWNTLSGSAPIFAERALARSARASDGASGPDGAPDGEDHDRAPEEARYVEARARIADAGDAPVRRRRLRGSAARDAPGD